MPLAVSPVDEESGESQREEPNGLAPGDAEILVSDEGTFDEDGKAVR